MADGDACIRKTCAKRFRAHPTLKYQSDGGPGVGEIADLLRRSMPDRTRRESERRLFDYLVYNVAIAGSDAHAKNFSLLLGSSQVRLAPLYDVASILPYDTEPGTKSAMKIGKTWEIAKVTVKDWEMVGTRLGMPRDEGVHRAEELHSRVPEAIHTAANEKQIPELLRGSAVRIADLVTAHVERRRDKWQARASTHSSRRGLCHGHSDTFRGVISW